MFSTITLHIFLSIFTLSLVRTDDIGKLPYCKENYTPGLALVSTIDGRLSAINPQGRLQWQIETEPGPLLVSNIHNLELTNSGKWIRIIPALSGALYRFDGLTIDPIPITAESLLKSSFKYSDDLVIAGGIDVRTYGIGFRTGKIFYTCSSLKCSNSTDNDNEVEELLLLERSTQTARAIEPQSGHERWNFSVGHHNIKLPQISCIDPNRSQFNWNLTAIIPDGLLLASQYNDNVEINWQYHFGSPIVKVWKWDGYKITEVDLFSMKNSNNNGVDVAPSIYIGMHKKQLYIHESYALLRKYTKNTAITESQSLIKIPWKPVSASGMITEEDSTALSVLYSSEYVNGNGYYLYSEYALQEKNSGLCENNNTLKYPAIEDRAADIADNFLLTWWKEIIVIIVTTTFIFRLIFDSFTKNNGTQNVIFVERHVEVPAIDRRLSENSSETTENSVYNSRFLNDFDRLRCLGKGGFGIVFEVKQKIDECYYAIKRITLPNESKQREAVMREVKALAKLEHPNIVRYFNSWVEKPPYGWQQQYDNEWLQDNYEPTTTTDGGTSQILSPSENSPLSLKKIDLKLNNNEINDSFIVFENSTNNRSNTKSINDISGKTELYGETITKSSSVNWKRPNRRYHTLNDKENPPVFLYIQMQLCKRESLKEWLVKNNERNPSNILDIFKQILSAVEYVHMQGLIHRDLKPSNIFFSLDGQIKVGDFGLVKDIEENRDMPQSNSSQRGHTKEVGTLLYMSPEQLDGKKYTYKVDIYSLGLIFYELLVYFSTDMERIQTLMMLRDNKFPEAFIKNRPEEYELLKMMLCQLPEKRLTTVGIRARPPINCPDDNYNQIYDFELPKLEKKW